MTAGQLPAVAPLSEKEWQDQVVELADLCGWHWLHIRPLRTATGWAVPISGPLGRGWPDLLLVHPRRKQHLLVELKSDTGRVTPEQRDVHAVLRASGLHVDVWAPRDWDLVVAALREVPGPQPKLRGTGYEVSRPRRSVTPTSSASPDALRVPHHRRHTTDTPGPGAPGRCAIPIRPQDPLPARREGKPRERERCQTGQEENHDRDN